MRTILLAAVAAALVGCATPSPLTASADRVSYESFAGDVYKNRKARAAQEHCANYGRRAEYVGFDGAALHFACVN